MKREIKFRPAFDKRDPDPKKDCGIHGVELAFYLTGYKGTVQLVLFTNWHLPHVTKERMGRSYETIGGDPHWMERPQPADLGYHSKIPMYEGHAPMKGKCIFIEGDCYYDGSGLNAQRVYEKLLTDGDEGVWKALEEYYEDTFKWIKLTSFT